MNNMLPRELIEQKWTRVRVAQYRADNIIDWIEQTIGEDNWSVWYGDYYFERAQDANLFALKFG